MARMSSSEFGDYQRSIADAERSTAELQEKVKAKQGEMRSAELQQLHGRIRATRREFDFEVRTREQLQQDAAAYRALGIEHYLNYLRRQSDEKRDLTAVFRVLGLWVGDGPVPPEVGRLVQEKCRGVPSHKFLSVVPQLVARIGGGIDPWLPELIKSLGTDHPYHVIWQVMALANGAKYAPEEAAVHAVDAQRIADAKAILESLSRRKDKGIDVILQETLSLCSAFLELGFLKLDKSHMERKTVGLSEKAALCKLKNLTRVVVPVLPVRVMPSGVYNSSQLETVVAFKPFFDLVGGINAPKLLYCQSSSGRELKILLKSRDDLRQDAVIQQTFSVCNAIFEHDREALSRRLQVSGYNVLPIAPTTGLVQWVDNCVELSRYLVEPHAGSHERYYPDEPSHADCRKALESASESEKVTTFKKITGRFTPTLHHFFSEHYATAPEWYERKQAYVKSASTTSIAGYLVGLGDRHVSNILLERQSALLVHIDLGVAFDQGSLLPVPETVPFRLTRELVDGMGIHGVEGPFRANCEVALRTLRDSRDLVQTVLETIIFDPLAKWAITLAPPMSGAGSAEGDVSRNRGTKASDSDARRAAARVRSKLTGYVGSEQLGVTSQTQMLIQTAMDEERLGRMFFGWSPWL